MDGKQTLSEIELKCTLREFVEIFWADGAFFSTFLSEQIMENDVTISCWEAIEEQKRTQQVDNDGLRLKYERKIVSQHPLPIQLYWLPAYIQSNVVQRIEVNDGIEGPSLLITNSAEVNGIPFVKPHVVTEWIVTEMKEKEKRGMCTVKISLFFVYEYTSIWISPLVESHSYRELMIYVDKYKKVSEPIVESWKSVNQSKKGDAKEAIANSTEFFKMGPQLKFLFEGEVERVGKSASHSLLDTNSTSSEPLMSLASLSAAVSLKNRTISNEVKTSEAQDVLSSKNLPDSWTWGEQKPEFKQKLLLLLLLLSFKCVDLGVEKFVSNITFLSNAEFTSSYTSLLVCLISSAMVIEFFSLFGFIPTNEVKVFETKESNADIPIFSYNCSRASSLVLPSSSPTSSLSLPSPPDSPSSPLRDRPRENNISSLVQQEEELKEQVELLKDYKNPSIGSIENKSQIQVQLQPQAPVFWIIPGVW